MRRRLQIAMLFVAAALPTFAWARLGDPGQILGAALLYAVPMGAVGVGFVIGEDVLSAEKRYIVLGASVLGLVLVALIVGAMLGRGAGIVGVWILFGGLVAMGLSTGVAALLRLGFDDPVGRSTLIFGLAACVTLGALVLTLIFGFGPGGALPALVTGAPFAAWAMAARRSVVR